VVGPYQSRSLPWYANVQVFPSCIPHSLDVPTRNALLAAAVAYSVEQSMQFPQNRGVPAETLIISQFKFVLTSFSSPFPPEKLRLAYFKRLNIQNDAQILMQIAKPIFNLVEELSNGPKNVRALSEGVRKAIEGISDSGIKEDGSKPVDTKGKGVDRGFEDGGGVPKDEVRDSDEEDEESEKQDFGISKDGTKHPAIYFYPPGLSNKQMREFRKERKADGFKGQFMDLPPQ